jgi:hypothetical protein
METWVVVVVIGLLRFVVIQLVGLTTAIRKLRVQTAARHRPSTRSRREWRPRRPCRATSLTCTPSPTLSECRSTSDLLPAFSTGST